MIGETNERTRVHLIYFGRAVFMAARVSNAHQQRVIFCLCNHHQSCSL